jgi:ketosteroid isomerase-like protein
MITKIKGEMNMTQTCASEVVKAYRTAISRGDFATARAVMQDDMTFQGPIDTFSRADDYLESLKKLAGIIQHIDDKKVFEDGDDICVLYDMVTNTPAGTAFIVEWYQVKQGKIATVHVIFDARPFAAMFGS